MSSPPSLLRSLGEAPASRKACLVEASAKAGGGEGGIATPFTETQ